MSRVWEARNASSRAPAWSSVTMIGSVSVVTRLALKGLMGDAGRILEPDRLAAAPVVERQAKRQREHHHRYELRGRESQDVASRVVAPELDREPGDRVQHCISENYLAVKHTALSQPDQQAEYDEIRQGLDQLGR